MKKIFFCTFLICVGGMALKAQEPPKRTTDAAPARPAATVSLPLKTGGGASLGTAQTVTRPAVMVSLPLKTGGGGSQGTAQTIARPASLPVPPGNGRGLPPSATAVRQDSLQKH